MISAILVDDEQHCLETLSLLLSESCPEIKIVEQCNSASKAIDAINETNPGLVFLDIEMPNMNGFELLEHLKEINFSVIFTTSYDQYAIKAIRFSALDYLLKPINRNELIVAIKKVQDHRFAPMAEQFQMLLKQIQNKEFQFNKIAVPTSEGFELVPVEQILRCEANDNYTHLVLKSKNKITACRTLKEIEEQLHDFRLFIRVHHSHLVNLNEVIRYVRGEGGYLVLSDGSTVGVSRSRKDALIKLF